MEAKSRIFEWSLLLKSAQRTETLDQISITDFDLDPRMEYYSVLGAKYPSGTYNGPMDIYVTDGEGTETLLAENVPQKIGGIQSETLVPPETTKIRIVMSEGYELKPGQNFNVFVTTKIKDPANVHYVDPTYNQKNYFHNYLKADVHYKELDADLTTPTISGNTRITKYEPKIRFTKTINPDGNVNIGDEMTVTLNLQTDYYDPLIWPDTLKNQALVDLLPVGVEYVPDSSKVQSDLNFTPSNPFIEKEPEVVENYQGTGRTALIWRLNPQVSQNTTGSLRYDNPVLVTFKMKVGINTVPGFNTNEAFYVWENNGSDPTDTDVQVKARFPYQDVPDEYDLDNDGNTTETVLKVTRDFHYSDAKEVVGLKRIKGSEDTNYVATGGREEIGKPFSYQLQVDNRSIKDIEHLTVLDVLPRIGDKSIVPDENGNFAPRNSQYDVYLTGPIEVPAGYTVKYNSVAPTENQLPHDYANTADWIGEDQVTDWDSIVGIQYTMGPGMTVGVGETSLATVPVTTKMDPENLNYGELAFNTFAYTINEGQSYVEATSASARIYTYEIRGKTFIDSNGNGYLDPDEPAVPLMKLWLLDENGTPVTNLKGEPIETTSDSEGNYTLFLERSGNYKVAYNNSEYFDATVLPPNAVNDDTASHITEGRPAVTETFHISPDNRVRIRNAGFKLMQSDVIIEKQVRDHRDGDLPPGEGPFTYQIKVNDEIFTGKVTVGGEEVILDENGKVSAFSGDDIVATVPVSQDGPTVVSVTEDSDPDYTTDQATQSVTLARKFERITFVNRQKPLGELTIRKELLCARGMPIDAAREFEVTVTGPSYPDGVQKTLTYGTDLVLDGLIYGDYTVVETENTDYETTQNSDKIRLTAQNKQGTVVITNTEKPLGEIVIQKSLKDFLGNPIDEDRQFTIGISGPSYPYGATRVVTPKEPLVFSNLIYGNYTITEEGAGDYDFVISNATPIDVDNKRIVVTVTNTERALGELTLEAILKNSKDEVLDEDRDFIVTLTGPSYPDGQSMVINPTKPHVLPGLQYGEYTLTAKPLDAYTTTLPEPVTLKIDAQKATMVTTFKEKDAGQISIIKDLRSATGDPLGDARGFEVTVTGPSYPAGEKMTLDPGPGLVLNDLIFGDYHIVETPDDNYTTTGGDVTLTVSPTQLEKTATINNKEIAKGQITVQKDLRDADNNVIDENREFEVTITGPSFPDGITKTLTVGTDLVLPDLIYGDYQIVETADDNYTTTVSGSGRASVTIDAKEAVVTVTNQENPRGELTLSTLIRDVQGNVVDRSEDFILTIRGPQYTGPDYPEGYHRVVVNTQKPSVLRNLKYGEYSVEVTSDDYTVTLPNPVTLSIESPEGAMLTEFQEKNLGQITVHKVLLDSAGQEIDAPRNFEVTVTGPSYPTGEVMTLTSGTDLVLDNLAYGTYTVVETTSDDYTTVGHNAEVTVDHSVKEKTVTITNKEKDQGTLTIVKALKDYAGNDLDADRNFEITVTGPSYPNGEKITLNSKEATVIENLAYGEYTVVETADAHYDTSVSGKVNLGVDAKTGTITVTNTEKALGKVTLNAIVKDADNNDVTGRKVNLKLFGPSYPEGMEFEVTSGTPLEVVDLIYGTYRIETVNPDNDYTTSVSDPVTLTVDNPEGTLTGTFTEVAKGTLTLRKVLKTNLGTDITTPRDFEVTITGPSYPTGERRTLTSGSDLVLTDLKYGSYSVEETANGDYDTIVSDAAILSIEKKEGSLTVTNTEKALGELIIVKDLKDVDGNPIDASRDFTVTVTGPSYPDGEDMTLNTKTPIELTNLIYGNYTITEKDADDYFVVTNAAELSIDAKATEVTVTNRERALGQLTLTAVLKDAAGNTLDESRELKVSITGPSYPDGQTMVLDPTKPLQLPGLKYGTYTLTSLEDEHYDVTLPEPVTLSVTEKEGTLETVFQEKAAGELTVQKIIKDVDGHTITEARAFEVTITGPSYPTGETRTLTAGTDLVVDNLIYGTYTVAETHEDYTTVISDPVTLTIGDPKATVTVTNTEKAAGSLVVKKVVQSNDGTTLDVAKDFEVTITGPSYPNGITQIVTSGSETGLVLRDLKYGEYTVAETHEDYTTVISDPVTLTADEKEGTITVTNTEKALGKVTIATTLLDGQDNPMDGRALKVKLFGPSYPEGKEYDVTSGTPLDITDLIYGDYRLETVDPDGHYTTSVSDPVSLTDENREGTLTATFKENPLGQLTIKKVLQDQAGNPIEEGRSFEVTITGPSYPTGERKTLIAGSDLVLDGLIYGEYTVTETANADYDTIGNNARVNLTMAENEGAVTLTNQEKAKGILTVHKELLTAEGQPSTAAKAFEITVTGPSYPKGKKMPLTNVTDLVLDNLIYGEYSVVETANAAYETTVSDNVTLSVDEKEASITVTNREKAEGVITLTGIYKDALDQVIEGKPIAVKLYGPSYPEGQAFTITSGTDLKVPNLVYGEYRLEVVDPEGNLATEISPPVTLTIDNPTGQLTAEVKEKSLGTLRITKVLKAADDTLLDEPRSFEVTITGPSYPTGEKKTLTNGTDLELTGLTYGQYTVVETPDEDYESTVSGPVTLSLEAKEGTVTVTNQEKAEWPDNGKITITPILKDSKGNVITDPRTFTVILTGPGDYADGISLTLTNGETLELPEGLLFGTYTLEAVDAEDYTVTLPDPIVLSQEQPTQNVEVIYQEKAEGVLVLKKVHKNLSGEDYQSGKFFTFVVTGPSYEDGKLFRVSADNPKRLDGLEFGDYEVYELSKETSNYTVSGEGTVTLDHNNPEGALTIVNTLKKHPIDPTDPTDPSDPTDPQGPTKPVKTVQPRVRRTWKRPFTGDSQDWPLALATLMISALSIAEIKRRQLKG